MTPRAWGLSALGLAVGWAGCVERTETISPAPIVDVGAERGRRERAVVFVDGSAEANRAARWWVDYFEDERRLPERAISSWKPDARAWRRLERAADHVPVGGRLWVVWIASGESKLPHREAVQRVSEGLHSEAIVVDQRCDGQSVPLAVRWRGSRASLIRADRPDGGERPDGAEPSEVAWWKHRKGPRADPVNVGFVTASCRTTSRSVTARKLVAALRGAFDSDGDGLRELSEISAPGLAELGVAISGVNLTLGPALSPKHERGEQVSSFVDAMVHLPTGSSWRGCVESDRECEEDERPARQIWLPSFAIDVAEVTWAEYAECVEDGGCRPIDGNRCYVYDTREGFVLRGLDPGSIDPSAPATCVSWDRAEAFCRWRGQALPTEAQWERAARGGSHEIHAWSDGAPTCEQAIHDGCATKARSAQPGLRLNTVGLADVIGNVAEWTHDWYDEFAYRHRGQVRAPTGPLDGEVRVVRGGSFYDSPSLLRVSYRYGLSPEFGYDIVGFRCVR